MGHAILLSDDGISVRLRYYAYVVLPTLSDDIDEIRHTINSLIETGELWHPRTDIKIPRLVANGLEIIELIEAEYGQ